MGCQITSVYNDEIIGKLSYSKPIISDIQRRDFQKQNFIQNSHKLSSKISKIYGFTQSFATANIYFTFFQGKQYIVYNAGRFIVIEQVKTRVQNYITSSESINCFVVKERLCLIGLNGGKITLWDLNFIQSKIQIILPQGSNSISSLGMTGKYIFAVDNSIPQNILFVYDIRTAKLKNYIKINLLDPILRSICFKDQTYIMTCQDGLLFAKYLKTNELQMTKGIFGFYPKTSMISIAIAGQHAISGGVDGYLYVWNISLCKCCHIFKVFDDEITTLCVTTTPSNTNFIIIGSMDGNVKVYTFKITKKPKKQTLVDIQDNQEDIQDNVNIIFVQVDIYQKESPITAMSISIKDPHMYQCHTRQGFSFRKWLPYATFQQRKLHNKVEQGSYLQQYASNPHIQLKDNKIYSPYQISQKTIYIDIYQIKAGTVKVIQQRIFTSKTPIINSFYQYLPQFQQIILINTLKQLKACQSYLRSGEAFSYNQFSQNLTNNKQIIQFDNQQLIRFNLINCKNNKILLIVTTNKHIIIFQRESKLLYKQLLKIQYQKQMPKILTFQDRVLIFQSLLMKWKQEVSQWSALKEQQIQKYKRIHGDMLNSMDSRWAESKISSGDGYLIFWKQY